MEDPGLPKLAVWAGLPQIARCERTEPSPQAPLQTVSGLPSIIALPHWARPRDTYCRRDLPESFFAMALWMLLEKPGLRWTRGGSSPASRIKGARESLVHLDGKAAAAETSPRLSSPATDHRLMFIGFERRGRPYREADVA